MEQAISVNNLVKRFGRTEALRGTSFTVRDREVYGLIGPNGAGKTTTLRILSTLISPSSGSAEVFGSDVTEAPEKIREIISYLPEDAGAYQNLSGFEYLEFMARIYAGSERQAEEMVSEGEKISGLEER